MCIPSLGGRRALLPVIAALFAMTAPACVGIPEPELDQLDAFERDWNRPVPIANDQPHDLKELQEAAIRRHPGLTSLFHRYKAALQQIILDGALDDPRVKFGYFIDSVETRVGPQDFSVGVSQTFPFFGKRDLRAEIALHQAQQLREALVEQRLRIARDVADSYWELFVLRGTHGLTSRQIDLLEQLANSIEARFLSGSATRADLLWILMEIDRQQTGLANLDKRARDARATLNTLLDRDPDQALMLDFPRGDADSPRMLPTLDDQHLLERARNFGAVRIQESRVLRQEAAIELAKLDYFPDFTVGYDYIDVDKNTSSPGPIKDNGKNAQLLGIGFNLPIWLDKNRAGVDRATELLKAERAARQQNIREAEARTVSAIETAREAEDNRQLYAGSLVPQAEERLELSVQDYVGDRVELTDLIDAERALLDNELGVLTSIAKRETALAELDYLTAGALGMLPETRPEVAQAGMTEQDEGVGR